jgi:replication factor C large subunit
MLYTSKYAPKKIAEIIGNAEKMEHVRQWFLQWTNGKKRKPLLVWGPPGTGKTAIAYALQGEFGLDILELNASELRNSKRVARVLGGASLAGSLSGRQRVVLVDDADVLAGRKDSGGGTAIRDFLRECPGPAIVTATDAWDKKIAPIRGECETVELRRISKISIRNLLGKIARLEGLGISGEALDAIAENASGDVRAALNDLQCLAPTARNHDKDIFITLRSILKANSYGQVREALEGEFDYEMLKLWIDENIPNEYKSRQDIAAAYRYLSLADVFDGRIKRSNWKLLKYSIDLSTAGVAIAKKGVYHQFTKYVFPEYLRSMSGTVAKRAILNALGRKIGAKLHVNSHVAREYLPLIKEQCGRHPDDVLGLYALDDDELAFIMETSVSRIKKKSP